VRCGAPLRASLPAAYYWTGPAAATRRRRPPALEPSSGLALWEILAWLVGGMPRLARLGSCRESGPHAARVRAVFRRLVATRLLMTSDRSAVVLTSELPAFAMHSPSMGRG
jgi:hypothetical protein